MEAKEKNYIQNKGITLVALVITIVILLILAGISISTLTNTGIFQKAKDAKQKAENAQKEEESFLSEYEKEILKQDSNGIWDGSVNKPDLMSGMMAIKFTEPTDITEGKDEKVSDSSKNDWYNYSEKKWANAKTNDGSMWVWIPRYAYKVVYNDPNDKSKGGKFDIVFLIGTTDNYIDDNGNIQTAQWQTEKNQVIETDSTKTDKYTVHPAFTNESSIDYANGGWNKELTGIWVAKFEAGYFDPEKEKDKIQESSVNYTQDYCEINVDGTGMRLEARNYIDKIYGKKTTSIKYPTFQGAKYSMNSISHGDAYSISKVLTESNNIYKLNEKITDSHLMKNSEWGAVAYLGQSKYGLNEKNIRINNVNVNDMTNFVFAVTGYAAKEDGASETGIDNAYRWTKKEGQSASNTGTIYGIYDLSGGTWERTAAIINNDNENLNKFGQSLKEELKEGKSSRYITVYNIAENDNQKLDEARMKNYLSNAKIYGDAIAETSTSGIGNSAWFGNVTHFPALHYTFFVRGGNFMDKSNDGMFLFGHHEGWCMSHDGFRAVLVKK